MNGNNLRDKIKERRLEKGLTMTELSTKSGVSESHIGRIERGERFPSGYILKKLAEPLGFTPIELLTLAGVLAPDEIDRTMEKLKAELRREAARCLGLLLHKIDSF